MELFVNFLRLIPAMLITAGRLLLAAVNFISTWVLEGIRLTLKRFLPVIAVLAASLAFQGPAPARAAEELLCSTFPIYLFTKAVAAGSDSFNVSLMVDSSKGCPHDYNPTPAELDKLAKARVMVINGLGLEGFLDQALRVARPDLAVIDASGGREAVVGFLAEPPDLTAAPVTVINREAARELSHDHDHGSKTAAGSGGPNPHLFASPRTAAMQVQNIARGLGQIDPAKADLYRRNGARLAQELSMLSGEAVTGLRSSLGNPKVIAGHGIFDYLARDWGLTIVAKIEAEDGAEPSAARLSELTRLARQEGVKAILIDPAGNQALARTLGAEAKIRVAVIDPVAGGPAEASPDYYQKVMITNLTVLLKLFAQPAAETGAAGPK